MLVSQTIVNPRTNLILTYTFILIKDTVIHKSFLKMGCAFEVNLNQSSNFKVWGITILSTVLHVLVQYAHGPLGNRLRTSHICSLYLVRKLISVISLRDPRNCLTHPEMFFHDDTNNHFTKNLKRKKKWYKQGMIISLNIMYWFIGSYIYFRTYINIKTKQSFWRFYSQSKHRCLHAESTNLTHWALNEMANIRETTFSNVFS